MMKNVNWNLVIILCLSYWIVGCSDEIAEHRIPSDELSKADVQNMRTEDQVSQELQDVLQTTAALPLPNKNQPNARLGDTFTYDLVTTAGVPTILAEFLDTPVRTEGTLELIEVESVERGNLALSVGTGSIVRLYSGTFTYEGGTSRASVAVYDEGSLFYELYLKDVPGTLRPIFISFDALGEDFRNIYGQIISFDPIFGLLGPNTVALVTLVEGTFVDASTAEGE